MSRWVNSYGKILQEQHFWLTFSQFTLTIFHNKDWADRKVATSCPWYKKTSRGQWELFAKVRKWPTMGSCYNKVTEVKSTTAKVSRLPGMIIIWEFTKNKMNIYEHTYHYCYQFIPEEMFNFENVAVKWTGLFKITHWWFT